MITDEFKERFAKHWIESWNSHDLAAILSHYAEDFEMNSPVIVRRLGLESGQLIGKENVGSYWEKALKEYPDLHFKLLNTLKGPNSITLYYVGAHGGMVAETFIFNNELKVQQVYANYE